MIKNTIHKTASMALGCTAMLLAGLTPAAAGSGDGAVDFRIVSGQAVPDEDYAVKVSVIGCSWGTANGDLGVMTVEVNVGDESIEPFGDAVVNPYGTSSSSSRKRGRWRSSNVLADTSLPSNVNTGGIAPIHMIIDEMFDSDAPVSVTGRAWEANSSVSTTAYVLNSRYETDAVMVLRDGDPVPTFSTQNNQTNVEVYLNPYTSEDSSTMMLHENQAIYLFEFNDLNGGFGIDYQDLVVMITFGETVEDLEDNPYPAQSDLGTAYD